MNRETQLTILLLREKLETLTGKKIIFKESISVNDIYTLIEKEKKNINNVWIVDNNDFQLNYEDKGGFMFRWIYLKTNKYKGKDILKALVKIAQKSGANEMSALASKDVVNGVETNGFYSLVKWGFEPTKGIDWINKVLGTNYKDLETAYNDPNFLPLWKTKGKECWVTFDLIPGSLSNRILAKE
jgi:hypothetical protein